MIKKITYCLIIFTTWFASSQNKINVTADFDIDHKEICISQYIEYFNTSKDTLQEIYLTDWNNSFSNKNTPLAERFAEEYNASFHFAKNEERGFTSVTSIQNTNKTELKYSRLKDQPDIIKVHLSNALLPNQSYKISLDYNVFVPSDKFTRYGVSGLNEYRLKYWYITPAIYNGSWQLFSNKNLDDAFIPKADITMQLNFPANYIFASELDVIETSEDDNIKTIELFGKNRVDTRLYIQKSPSIKTTQTDKISIISDIQDKNLGNIEKAIIIDKVVEFVESHLGEYPHDKILVTEIDVKKNPIYGLNQLPDFIRPFPEYFHFELKLLKNTISNYLNNVLLINPRKEQWLKDGIESYFLMKYIEESYPDMKLLGNLANIWGIRSFHAADLKFNEQYGLFYMHMARTNRDQSLTTPKDSLMKFNNDLANKFKAGVGLKYLDEFINGGFIDRNLKSFIEENALKPITTIDFKNYLNSRTNKNLDWFFNDYVKTRKKIDYKIAEFKKTEDSISFKIKNKKNTNVPISLFTFNKDSLLSKTWITDVKSEKRFTFPRGDIDKIVLNDDNVVPEYNLRNNRALVSGLLLNKKPLQIRLFQDFEDPNYSQLFLMPTIEFRNIYDGVTVGAKFYNKTVLRKAFNYRISPLYSLKSKSLTGTALFNYFQNIDFKSLYRITYGLYFGYKSYAQDLYARQLTPYLIFNFRDKDNFRSKKFQALNIRYLDINRDEDPNNILATEEPNYGVFNIRYINTNPGLINYNKWFTDFQLSKDFGKISLNYEYRKLFNSNRQINFRLFAGTFLYNKNPSNNDYFSFALDRPTDYLFDYNYLGRAEASGLVSQQLIIAEGGFKSVLDTPYANQWLTTINSSTTIWNYIQAYGDIGLVKNKNKRARFVYDSGIRLNLVTDYFEIYFPIYSNLGWEVGQKNYDQKIRFLFTVDPQTLFGLFRRKWY